MTMDKYELDKKIKKLEEILSALGGIHDDIDNLSSRLDDAIYDLEDMRSDLEAFGDELDKENKDGE